ncbi:MAG: DNA double-strand break repair nuclease NurA [Chloroflexi bacterium]|nr:DNA double-strand break repair nuclease NurA [Chloroflexota bacterium]
MVLEFHKLTGQVDQMGSYLASQEQENHDKIELALSIMEAHAHPDALPYILDRVQQAVARDAGYRGARPLDEPIMDSYMAANLPERATLIATDGSQVYPNEHNAAQYYLINIGTIIVPHGTNQIPEILIEPYLFYDSIYLYQNGEGLITNRVINARRQVYEMSALAEHAWHQREAAEPLITLQDGPLLFVMGREVPERLQLLKLYFSAMDRLAGINAGLAGYTDVPGSTFMVRLLHLLTLEPEHVTRTSLSHSGKLQGLYDRFLYAHLLGPAERSPLFVQMSPQNKEFRNTGGDDLEIAFFYLNVAGPDERPHVVRVDIPMWVTKNRMLISQMQALLYHQCQQITKRYPYVLMRADELATVRSDESRQLDMMIKVAMLRNGLDVADSAKQMSKMIGRAGKSRFDMNRWSGKSKRG